MQINFLQVMYMRCLFLGLYIIYPEWGKASERNHTVSTSATRHSYLHNAVAQVGVNSTILDLCYKLPLSYLYQLLSCGKHK